MDFEKVKRFFNRTAIRENLHVSIGTVDRNGIPNVAPTGSFIILNDKTAFLLQAFLDKTYRNLRENPYATFMGVRTNKLYWSKYFLTGKFSESPGYRVYCRFLHEKSDPKETEKELRLFDRRFRRVAWFKGGKRIKDALKRVLVFEIREVREVKF